MLMLSFGPGPLLAYAPCPMPHAATAVDIASPAYTTAMPAADAQTANSPHCAGHAKSAGSAKTGMAQCCCVAVTATAFPSLQVPTAPAPEASLRAAAAVLPPSPVPLVPTPPPRTAA